MTAPLIDARLRLHNLVKRRSIRGTAPDPAFKSMTGAGMNGDGAPGRPLWSKCPETFRYWKTWMGGLELRGGAPQRDHVNARLAELTHAALAPIQDATQQAVEGLRGTIGQIAKAVQPVTTDIVKGAGLANLTGRGNALAFLQERAPGKAMSHLPGLKSDFQAACRHDGRRPRQRHAVQRLPLP